MKIKLFKRKALVKACSNKKHIHERSEQHYSEQPKSENNSNVHQLINERWHVDKMDYSSTKKELSTEIYKMDKYIKNIVK